MVVTKHEDMLILVASAGQNLSLIRGVSEVAVDVSSASGS